MLKKNIKDRLVQSIKNKIKNILGVGDFKNIDLNSTYNYPESWVTNKHFYGQYGEDSKLRELFKNKKDGYFVEVGAMEGVRFSNTFLFEKLGWRGICIEPHPDYFNLLKKNRTQSICIQAAAGSSDKDGVNFYTNYRGSMSTLDKNLEGFFKSHYGSFFGGFKTIQVPQITLNNVFEKYKVPIEIDLLSIDTEGTEEDVFSGLDFNKYKPRVVIAEISIRREPVERVMKQLGYIECCTNPSNTIFCRSEEDAEIIRNTCVAGGQIEVLHPLDEINEK
jgi:FkbM family methyltransferase